MPPGSALGCKSWPGCQYDIALQLLGRIQVQAFVGLVSLQGGAPLPVLRQQPAKGEMRLRRIRLEAKGLPQEFHRLSKAARGCQGLPETEVRLEQVRLENDGGAEGGRGRLIVARHQQNRGQTQVGFRMAGI